MAQRLGIAAAMLGDPPVLVFDEPINGLDPDGIRWIRVFLRSLADEGRAVLVSSHLMSELEDIADELVVIGRGRLIAQTSVGELLGVQIRRSCPRPDAAGDGGDDRARGCGWNGDLDRIRHPRRRRPRAGAHRRARRRSTVCRLHELYRERASLEDAFIDLTRDAVEYVSEQPGPAGVSTTAFAGVDARAGGPQALRAEWVKLRTVRSTFWSLLLLAGVSILFTALQSSGSSTRGREPGRAR